MKVKFKKTRSVLSDIFLGNVKFYIPKYTEHEKSHISFYYKWYAISENGVLKFDTGKTVQFKKGMKTFAKKNNLVEIDVVDLIKSWNDDLHGSRAVERLLIELHGETEIGDEVK